MVDLEVSPARRGAVVVGIGGWDYPQWKGQFYPQGLARHAWLAFAGARFDAIELNTTFYGLRRPEHFERWAAAVPDGAVFAIKGSRHITHEKRLVDVDSALANFFASGILKLGRKTGPFLWQLPQSVPFQPEVLARFFDLLPRSSTAAAQLARHHDDRLKNVAVEVVEDVELRHVLEPRHPGFFTEDARRLLDDHGIGLVLADTAGTFPMAADPGRGVVYVRLHGSRELYTSPYSNDEIAGWAERLCRYADDGRDVYVFLDNTRAGHAPFDAQSLQAAVRGIRGEPTSPTR